MYKKVSGVWYKMCKRVAWYGDKPARCSGCHLMGMNGRCMVPNELPECKERSDIFFGKVGTTFHTHGQTIF